ncbi:MAG TPA: hypothetical protein VNL15_03855 [Dehalococcoidia bacterium]|nr:hypothetical protein [Dehalococcoidia bacterium]
MLFGKTAEAPYKEGQQPGVPADQAIHPGVGNPVTYFIVQRDGDGAPKTHICQNDREAQAYLETLLAEGVAKETIELYRASKARYEVTFKPMVSLPTLAGL